MARRERDGFIFSAIYFLWDSKAYSFFRATEIKNHNPGNLCPVL